MPHQNQPKAHSPLSPEPWRTRARMNSHFTKRWTWTMPERRRMKRTFWVLYQSSKAVHCPLNAPIVPLWEDRPGRAGSGNWPYNRGMHKEQLVQTEAWKPWANVCFTNTHTPTQTLRWNAVTPSCDYYLIRCVNLSFYFLSLWCCVLIMTLLYMGVFIIIVWCLYFRHSNTHLFWFLMFLFILG